MARIAGINIPQNKVVCIALTYIHGIGLHSSKKICKELDIDYDNDEAHSAAYDAMITAQVFCKIINDFDDVNSSIKY